MHIVSVVAGDTYAAGDMPVDGVDIPSFQYMLY